MDSDVNDKTRVLVSRVIKPWPVLADRDQETERHHWWTGTRENTPANSTTLAFLFSLVTGSPSCLTQ